MTSGGATERWRRVAEIVGEALERDPAGRGSWLDAACASYFLEETESQGAEKK